MRCGSAAMRRSGGDSCSGHGDVVTTSSECDSKEAEGARGERRAEASETHIRHSGDDEGMASGQKGSASEQGGSASEERSTGEDDMMGSMEEKPGKHRGGARPWPAVVQPSIQLTRWPKWEIRAGAGEDTRSTGERSRQDGEGTRHHRIGIEGTGQPPDLDQAMSLAWGTRVPCQERARTAGMHRKDRRALAIRELSCVVYCRVRGSGRKCSN